MTPIPLTYEDQQAGDSIGRCIPGYSGYVHQAFFKMLLAQPNVNNILILGVYHGRDMALILDLAKRHRPNQPLYLWGVDKLSDDACEDWPEDKKALNWEQAGFGRPPATVSEVKANLQKFVGPFPEGIDFNVVQMDDSEFLEGHAHHPLKFDAVYQDTSHDYDSVRRQIPLALAVMRPDGILCGDDYSDESNAPGGKWGVKKAVTEAFPKHTVYGNWIWMVEPTLT